MIGIIFHPHIHPDEQAEALQPLKALIVRPGTAKSLSRFAERVVMCELQFPPQWFAECMLTNPLGWDFPEANAYGFFYSELQEILGDDFSIKFEPAPRFPKSIMAKTFNRDTATAYLEKVWRACDGGER